ncbi:MAG TPA: D-cysteine desulfhydrase family protein [Acidimicrobiia bacterium]|nr:D-cysteine desulfhydrase family protein [Acidimicrobiia bacterium]
MTDRVTLAHLPTPVEELPRFASALHGGRGPRILIKRDDQTGLALGGNKTRKLERLCADALARDCDVIVTGGGVQSNHARQTAAAAAHLGIECALALAGRAPETPSGNLLLDHVFGATIEYADAPGYYDAEAAIEQLAARLAARGRRPYAIPVGGASTPGVLAYVDACDEVRAQGVDVDWMFVADGSGGTHAGLLVGLGAGSHTRVVGVDVGTRPDLVDAVPALARAAAEVVGRPWHDDVIVDTAHVGGGYGTPSDAAVEAITTVARTEGIVLDPVYTGKAMAALMTFVRDGSIGRDDTVLFWHTGGAPALFAPRYARLFKD